MWRSWKSRIFRAAPAAFTVLATSMALRYDHPDGSIWLVAVPLDMNTRIMRPLGAAVDTLPTMNDEPILPDPLGPSNVGFLPPDTRIRHRRIEFSPNWKTSKPRGKRWFALGDRGQFLSQLGGSVRIIQTLRGDSGGPWLLGPDLLRGVLLALMAYSRLAKHFGVSGEVSVRCGVTRPPSGPVFYLPPGRASFVEPRACETDADAETDVDLSDMGDVMRAAKDLLDDLATGFGLGEFSSISREGKLVVGTLVDEVYWSQWATKEGVPFE